MLTGTAEVELHMVPVCPKIQRFRDELRTVIDKDRLRSSTMFDNLLQNRDDVVACQAFSGMRRQTLTGKVINYNGLGKLGA